MIKVFLILFGLFYNNQTNFNSKPFISHCTGIRCRFVCLLFYFVVFRDIGTALQHSQFGSGSGLFHYERLGCRGDEDTLSKCRSRTFVTGDCSHGNQAAVACAPPEGQLDVNVSTPNDGKKLILFFGLWGDLLKNQIFFVHKVNHTPTLVMQLIINQLSAVGNKVFCVC